MIWRAFQYLKFLFRSTQSVNGNSSLFHELMANVFQEKTPYYAFEEIESVRAKLLLTDKEIKVIDLGAGSKKNNKTHRKINQITRLALKRPKKAQLLFRLANYLKAQSIVELGTSFGITTAYLARACPKAKIVTIEGSPEVAKVARINLKKLNVLNVQQVVSNFETALPIQLRDLKEVDFVFFDGNHRKQPTLDYFAQCLDYSTTNSVFVFDDIYWSKGMKEAWDEIKNHPKVKLTIDCFEMGMVFFQGSQLKEHYTVYH